MGASTVDESEAQSEIGRNSRDQVAASSMGPPPSFDGSGLNATTASRQSTKASFDESALGHGNPLQLVQPTPVSGIEAQANTMASSLNQCRFPHQFCPSITSFGHVDPACYLMSRS